MAKDIFMAFPKQGLKDFERSMLPYLAQGFINDMPEYKLLFGDELWRKS